MTEDDDGGALTAFGKDRGNPQPTPNPYRFGGAWGYMTGSSGLQQLGARFYWPDIGRFITQDPIGDGMNWYVYVDSNPLVWIDPEGLHLTESTWHNLTHWDCIWGPGLVTGLAILGDTVVPFADPLKDAGVYDPNDPFNKAASGMAYIGVTAAEAAGAIWALESAGILRFPENSGGFELSFGKNFRVGWGRLPTKGNWRVPWARGRSLPHYHLRRPGPGGGIGRHRPWQGW